MFGIKVSRMIKILHLLFVDDVIIMTNAKLAEWTEIQKILSIFYKATGLRINVQKSSFHHSGVQNEVSEALKILYYIESTDLSGGFNYLCYFLKPTSYRLMDWNWLIEKFKRRINLWCYRLLTLGGRYILAKVVLESLPVYWLAT